jgi:transcription elongation factor Elf1
MGSLAEAALVIAVIALAIRNRTLKKEKELLFKQLCGMRDGGEGKSPEPAAAQTKKVVSEVPKIETELFCPNCKSGPTEIYEGSREGGLVCRACDHTWIVSNQPGYCPVVPSTNSPNREWTYADQNTSCPDCGSTEFEMRTYGGPWEYADTHCAKCGKLIRRFDAA